MKIDGPVLIPKSGGSEQTDPISPPGVRGGHKGVTRLQDEAQFSIDRGKVQELKAKLAESPEIRQEKVQALQQVVQEGRYQVSNEQLAQAIYSELLDPAQLR